MEIENGRFTRDDMLRLGALGGLAIGGLGGGTQALLNAAQAFAASPKRGGHFNIMIQGGTDKESMDAQDTILDPDGARLVATYERLLTFNEKFQVVPELAKSFTAHGSKGDVWDIVVRSGILFHNGKELVAEDVIFSINRMNAPTSKTYAASILGNQVDTLTKTSKYSVRMKLKAPNVLIREAFAQYMMGIVPDGYKGWAEDPRPAAQVGTGPFKLKSFTPGKRSEHVRNPHYWRTGQPYLDSISIIDAYDESQKVGALLDGQVHAITSIEFSAIKNAQRAGFHVYEGKGGGWVPFTMRTDHGVTKDVRVRQALRLIADRPKLVKVAYAGHGRVGNDVYSPLDVAYNSALPQRHQDIAQAKSLLKKAGKTNLTLDLYTTDGRAGQVAMCDVYAADAKKAGVKVNVHKQGGEFWNAGNYLSYDFGTDYWGTHGYLNQVAAGSTPKAAYNETHWADPTFLNLYKQALGQVDDKKRADIIHAMQKIEYTSGGYIIWGFYNLTDAVAPKVLGLGASAGTLPLNSYGQGFRLISFK